MLISEGEDLVRGIFGFSLRKEYEVGFFDDLVSGKYE